MKFKMSEKSLFAVLLRSPWWISISMAAMFGLACKAFLSPAFVPFGIMGALPFMVIGVIAAWRQWRAPDPEKVEKTLAQITGMTWVAFSAALEAGYQRQGYTVEKLKTGAADFKLSRDSRTTVVQCKRWKAASVGQASLRELVAVQQSLAADQALVIALGSFTDAAKLLVNTHHIGVVTDGELATLIAG